MPKQKPEVSGEKTETEVVQHGKKIGPDELIVVMANLFPETGADHHIEIGDICFHSMCSQTNRGQREPY